MRSYSDRDQLSQIVMMIAPDGRVRMDRLSATPLKPDIQPWETDTSEEEEEAPWEGRTRWWFFENEDLRDYVEDGDGFEPDDGSLRAKAPIPATPSGNAVLLDLDGYGLHGGDSREYFDSISWIAPTRGPATLSRQHLNRWDRVYVNAHHLRFVKVFSFPPR
ncbi:hypothetical protein KJ940_02725 [Myxococcota bacterium]|nr:hypothetical protein [Myxococcota bacterium]